MSPVAKDRLAQWLEKNNLQISPADCGEDVLLVLNADAGGVDMDAIAQLEAVAAVERVSAPYKLASRKSLGQSTRIANGNAAIGGGDFSLIAGPCSVESAEQIVAVAKAVKASGAGWLRGGAYKPRTSPYTFHGLEGEGIRLLLEAKQETGIPVVSEIMDISQLALFEDVDVIQVGARNMQNYTLLRELGLLRDKPILLKRGLASTLDELLMSAEYIMAGGNMQVILCERGIRTFETHTRNTLDLSAVPVLKSLSHLPVLVDPSHGTGHAQWVPAMALAAVAAGADGVMIEVHGDPQHAMCDGQQALTPEAFHGLAKQINAVRSCITQGIG